MHLKAEKKKFMQLYVIMESTGKSPILGNQISLNPADVKNPSERGVSVKANFACEKCLYFMQVKLYTPLEGSIKFFQWVVKSFRNLKTLPGIVLEVQLLCRFTVVL